MTIHELIQKYGTHTIPVLIKELAAHKQPEDYKMIKGIADDLQAALEDYASEDFEPPTVGNEVV